MRNKYVLFGALALCACLSSCRSISSIYRYVQVYTVEPIANATTAQKTDEGLVYENEDCIVSYHFWGEGGDAGFVFYNKTDKVIHIDLSQTFFVKNGVAYDYYIPTIITKSTSASTGSISLSGSSETIATIYQPILSIPPKTTRIVSLYNIREKPFDDCDLNAYPKQSERLTYVLENSPLTFANYITYSIGDSGNTQLIENQFYISEVANYAEPYILTFVPLPETCDNLLTPYEQYTRNIRPQLFKAYYNVDRNNTFYITYSIRSEWKLYKDPKGYRNYVWSSYYKAYTNSTKNNSVAPK